LVGGKDEAGADGVVVDVVEAGEEVLAVADTVLGEAGLPDGEFRVEAVREAALDKAHGAFDGDFERGEEEMDVVGHDDEGVELEVAFVAIVLECFDEERGVGVELEEGAAVGGGAGYEVGV
jgi:hypothetical protein